MEHHCPFQESSGHSGYIWASPKLRREGADVISGYQDTRIKADTHGLEVLA